MKKNENKQLLVIKCEEKTKPIYQLQEFNWCNEFFWKITYF